MNNSNPLSSIKEIAYVGKCSLDKINLIQKYVYWRITDSCVYACSYCAKNLYSGNTFIDANVVIKTFNELPKSIITLGGGEPTYHPEIEKIIEEKPNHIELGIISNGAKPFTFWEKYGQKIDRIILTYHSEYAKLDRFLELALFLHKNKKTNYMKINLAMNSRNWGKCLDAYSAFIDSGIDVQCKPLLDEFANGKEKTLPIIPYTTEQISWIKEHNCTSNIKLMHFYDHDNRIIGKTSQAEMLSLNQTNFKDWLCYVPVTNLLIDERGDVYNMVCKQRKKVGNVYETFPHTSEPEICKLTKCWCFSDILGVKVKPS